MYAADGTYVNVVPLSMIVCGELKGACGSACSLVKLRVSVAMALPYAVSWKPVTVTT